MKKNKNKKVGAKPQTEKNKNVEAKSNKTQNKNTEVKTDTTKNKNTKQEKALTKTKQKEEKKPNKFTEFLKKKIFTNGTATFFLVIAIIAAFVGIGLWMQKLDLTPIDLTEDKLYTLSDESKEKVKNIDKEIDIYFVGYSEDDTNVDLAKEYTKVNDKIKVEVVTADSRPDLVQKYQIDMEQVQSNPVIIVECGDRSQIIRNADLTTYDMTTYETINVAEDRITAAIEKAVSDKIPKIYFLTGYSQFTLQSGLTTLNAFLANEVSEAASLNILSTGKVPDDCDTLVITTPVQDFDDTTTQAITDYVNKGGNILWLNAAIAQKLDLPNVNKILALYGVQPFEVGTIYETDTSRMVAGMPTVILPTVESTDVTEKLVNAEVMFFGATKINMLSSEELKNMNVTETDLVQTSESAFFRSNYSVNSVNPQDGEEKKAYTVGAQFDKVITEKNEENNTPEVKSTLIIYGENYFASDATLSQGSSTPIISYAKNKDLVLNSIAYLSDRKEDITVRKGTGNVTYQATAQETGVILTIILGVPIIIIIIGIFVWISRKRRK